MTVTTHSPDSSVTPDCCLRWRDSIDRHCTSCHSDMHNRCEGCGRCMDGPPRYWDYLTVRTIDRPWERGPKLYPHRADRRYCGNACRQRTYRTRAS